MFGISKEQGRTIALGWIYLALERWSLRNEFRRQGNCDRSKQNARRLIEVEFNWQLNISRQWVTG
jgi:hypothetical protein